MQAATAAVDDILVLQLGAGIAHLRISH